MFKKCTILKLLNNPHLRLYKGEGYFYFVYDDGKSYHDRTVYAYTLNQLPIDIWLYEGRMLLEEINGSNSFRLYNHVYP